MGLKMSVDASELRKASAKLQEMQLRASDITEAAPAIRLLLQQDVDLRFQSSPAVETGGVVYGDVNWAPLEESYLSSRPIRRGGQVLRDTGELMQSMTAEGHPYNVFEVSDSEIVFGTALAKAGRLQAKRPFIFWHPILLEKVADYLANWIGG